MSLDEFQLKVPALIVEVPPPKNCPFTVVVPEFWLKFPVYLELLSESVRFPVLFIVPVPLAPLKVFVPVNVVFPVLVCTKLSVLLLNVTLFKVNVPQYWL